MALNKDNLERKKDDVRKFFKKLTDTREYGVPKYTTQYCLNKTAQKFYLAPTTVQKYVYSAENGML